MNDMPTIRLTQRDKEMLITLKRRTGIKTWNVLCRWALATSLAEESEPAETGLASEPSNVELSWDVLAGGLAVSLGALIVAAEHRSQSLGRRALLQRHISRGITRLIRETESGQLLELAVLKLQ